jgi:cyclophilin family peptidyl-prolyl cis-trans isomerase/HEAT repeat protein
MNRSHRTPIVVVALATLLASGCAMPDARRSSRHAVAYLRITAAEDARPADGPELDVLVNGTADPSSFLRQVSVRALGRLERPELVDRIRPLLNDPIPAVRAEAANALAQAVHRSDDDAVVDGLLAHAATESDSLVLAALARSLGRTATTPTRLARASSAIVRMSRIADGTDAPLPTLLGAALGLESYVRAGGGRGLPGDAATRLVELMRYRGPLGREADAARVRALAVSTLGQARRLDAQLIDLARNDDDAGVRVAAARFVDALLPDQRPEMLRRFLRDPSRAVAIEAFRQIAGEPATELYCTYMLSGIDPRASASLRVSALGGLGRPCPQAAEQRETLRTVVDEVDTAGADRWHAPTHALLALARVAPEDARARLPRFATHPNPFARAWAARVAGVLRDAGTLRSLASDPVANVRTAALETLFALEGHAIDELLLAQTGDDDPQLLMTVARLLEGTPESVTAAGTLLDAFERISAAERETWRDPRSALLDRLAEVGDGSLADRLTPYLSDYDPAIAQQAATLLEAWTGRAHATAPPPLPRTPLPTSSAFDALVDARIALHMRAGGTIVIELDPYAATTSVARFARLAEAGYFDGLTFHRWATNFVIQGGSPGANEYEGDGPYGRDEVGLPVHWRGTVGISTRGRDTGDAQIFVNLVDNVRLDHDYTIVGAVVEGMDVVDDVLEGSVIERAEVVRAR